MLDYPFDKQELAELRATHRGTRHAGRARGLARRHAVVGTGRSSSTSPVSDSRGRRPTGADALGGALHAQRYDCGPAPLRFPWAQTIVTVGLLKIIHGRWCCLPLAFAFYFRCLTLQTRCVRVCGEAQAFQTKFARVVALTVRLGAVFTAVPVLVV